MPGLIIKIFISIQFSSIGKCLTSLEQKIIGGDYVSIQNHPHAVFLEISNDVDEIYICGSSVLNQQYLLSAAHCFNDDKGSQISAYGGHENINKAIVYRKVKQSIVHQNYKYATVENDIALLLLEKELPLGEYIKRIILRPSFPNRAAGAVAGWGIINEVTAQESLYLKSIRQTVRSKEICAIVGITKSTFCAGSIRVSDPRPAPGDSGSGLVSKDYQLLGIVSYNIGIYSALPVYTNVSYFYHWIKLQTQFASCLNELNLY